MRWKCKGCRYIKHFTRPVAFEAAGRCPRCKSTEFRPILRPICDPIPASKDLAVLQNRNIAMITAVWNRSHKWEHEVPPHSGYFSEWYRWK